MDGIMRGVSALLLLGALLLGSQAQAIQLHCSTKPSACGYPDATNTGVRSGVILKRVPGQVRSGIGWHWDDRGWVSIDGNGAVFHGYLVNATVDVIANNVTISDVRVRLNGETFGIALRHTKGTKIRYVEVGAPSTGERLRSGIVDIYGDSTGTDIRFSEITRTATGIQLYSGVISDNYIHAMGYKSGDHTNGTTSNGSKVPLLIRNNTVYNQLSQTDAISLFQDFGVEANRLITDNLVAGGAYTIYAGQNVGHPPAYNIRVTNNRFSRRFWPNGGQFGPATAYNRTALHNVWSGNFWDDSGLAVPAP